jgi:hypothetical protein
MKIQVTVFWIVKMEAARFFETPVSYRNTTRYHYPEDFDFKVKPLLEDW